MRVLVDLDELFTSKDQPSTAGEEQTQYTIDGGFDPDNQIPNENNLSDVKDLFRLGHKIYYEVNRPHSAKLDTANTLRDYHIYSGGKCIKFPDEIIYEDYDLYLSSDMERVKHAENNGVNALQITAHDGPLLCVILENCGEEA